MTPPPLCKPYPVETPPERVYRVCIGPDPIRLRPRETVTPESPLNGRWDDSYGDYRVLYTASTAEGALREALQRWVPTAEMLEAAREIGQEPGEDPFSEI